MRKNKDDLADADDKHLRTIAGYIDRHLAQKRADNVTEHVMALLADELGT